MDLSHLVRRSQIATVVGLGLAAIAAGPAAAKPVPAGATPLSMTGLRAYAPCPELRDLDGTRSLATMRSRGADALYGRDGLVPTTAIVVCDPELAAAQRFIGPFSGDTKTPLAGDIAYFGLRALAGETTRRSYPALAAGDRLALPAIGQKAMIDVTVATPGGARTVRVPAAGARPTAVHVDGTDAAPTLVVDRDGADATRVAITPRPVVPFRLKVRSKGKRLTFTGSAAPDSAFIAFRPDAPDRGAYLKLVGPSGRLAALRVPLTRQEKLVFVVAGNDPARQMQLYVCKVEWNKKTRSIKRSRCGESLAEITDPVNGVGQSAGAASAASAGSTLGVARRLATGLDRSRSRARTHPAAPRAAAARANPKPPKLATVPAVSQTLITTKETLQDFSLTDGDMNGDGLPDAGLWEWSFDNDDTSSSLLVSTAEARWAKIPVQDSETAGFSTLPDLTGDGRGELRLGLEPSIITDAFASPTLPTSLNVSKTRTSSPNDLELDVSASVSNGNSSPYAPSTELPIGEVDDVTGDGRPEVVFDGAAPLVMASQDLVPGQRKKLATVAPIQWVTPPDRSGNPYASAPGEISTVDQHWVTHVASGHALVTAIAANAGAHPEVARPITLTVQDGNGRALHQASFTSNGVPTIVDYDAASGEALVMLWHLGRCAKGTHCSDRLVRVAADGSVLASVRFPRVEWLTPEAAFTPDGPDADDRLDVAISDARNKISAPAAPPRWPGDRGTIAILASTSTGEVPRDSLPVLAANGVPLQSMMNISSATLPNGSRWIGGGFQTTNNPKKDVRQRNAIVWQAK